jgi:hypothetical protein
VKSGRKSRARQSPLVGRRSKTKSDVGRSRRAGIVLSCGAFIERGLIPSTRPHRITSSQSEVPHDAATPTFGEISVV